MKKIIRLIKYYLFKKKGLFYPGFADDFYTFHQEKLRGSIDEIKKRQAVYLKYIKIIPKQLTNKYYFLDIGFGRGEFIDLLKGQKLKNVKGVDTNRDYVLKAKQKGYDVYHENALKHLYLSEKQYYGISAFHLIEHIDFNQLFDLLLLCSKKLAKGGVLILETPNVENIKVGSTSFYLDYTHKLKLPSLLLKTLLEYLGFTKIEFLYLQPEREIIENDIEHLMFSGQDLGIIAYR